MSLLRSRKNTLQWTRNVFCYLSLNLVLRPKTIVPVSTWKSLWLSAKENRIDNCFFYFRCDFCTVRWVDLRWTERSQFGNSMKSLLRGRLANNYERFYSGAQNATIYETPLDLDWGTDCTLQSMPAWRGYGTLPAGIFRVGVEGNSRSPTQIIVSICLFDFSILNSYQNLYWCNL